MELPPDAGRDLWEAAKTAGPFGNLLLLCLLVFVSNMYRRERRLNEGYAERVFTLAESTKHVLEDNNGLLDKNNDLIGTVKDAILYQFNRPPSRRRGARKPRGTG